MSTFQLPFEESERNILLIEKIAQDTKEISTQTGNAQ